MAGVNLNGMFLCAQGAFGLMKRQKPQGGRIINNGSISAHTPRPLSIAYNATKHAVTGLTKSIALDGRVHISPAARSTSATSTEMACKQTLGVRQADGRIALMTMDVEEVGEAVVTMAKSPLDQHPDHDHHGDQDAGRPGIARPQGRESAGIDANKSHCSARRRPTLRWPARGIRSGDSRDWRLASPESRIAEAYEAKQHGPGRGFRDRGGKRRCRAAGDDIVKLEGVGR